MPQLTGTRYFALAGLSAFVGLCGCSPPPPDLSSGADLVVQMPGSEGGQLSDTPINPPDLAEVDPGQVTQRVQRSGGKGAELVPAPRPDGGGKKNTESIPTPTGAPEASDTGEPFPDAHAAPEDWERWPAPTATLVITGQQNGYIEPCGCTGLDRQKGGIARRFTFMENLRSKGWKLLALDAGNQVRRFGRQAEVKLQTSAKALEMMDYEAVGFGPDDVRLGVGELLSVAANGGGQAGSMFASANVVLIDESLVPQIKIAVVNGMKVGITSILDPALLKAEVSDDIKIGLLEESTMKALTLIKEAAPDFRVLMYFGKEEDGKKLIQNVSGFDLIVVAGGYGEPTFQPMEIEESETRMIVTGNKGMYAGLVGLYQDSPLRYARVPLTHDFQDAPEMRQLMKEYQDQLRDIGLEGLGLLPPIPHVSGQKFVGTAKCAECHKSAFEVFEGTPHALATEHLVKPPKERGDIARHFDPECLSCHVTGWNPQEFYPYLSGYLSLEASDHLTGSGCENCHGPGSEHVAAEAEGSDATEELRSRFRDSMKLPLEKAREKCMTCHDLDNSPDFHEEDAFEDVYWPQVEHYGLD